MILAALPFSLETESLLLLNTSVLYIVLINAALVEFCVMQACAGNDDTAVTLMLEIGGEAMFSHT